MGEIRSELIALKNLTMQANSDRRDGNGKTAQIAASTKERVNIELRKEVPQGKMVARKEMV